MKEELYTRDEMLEAMNRVQIGTVEAVIDGLDKLSEQYEADGRRRESSALARFGVILCTSMLAALPPEAQDSGSIFG